MGLNLKRLLGLFYTRTENIWAGKRSPCDDITVYGKISMPQFHTDTPQRLCFATLYSECYQPFQAGMRQPIGWNNQYQALQYTYCTCALLKANARLRFRRVAGTQMSLPSCAGTYRLSLLACQTQYTQLHDSQHSYKAFQEIHSGYSKPATRGAGGRRSSVDVGLAQCNVMENGARVPARLSVMQQHLYQPRVAPLYRTLHRVQPRVV